MNVSIQEILTQAFGFAILLFILKRLAWKPMLDLLETRRTKIAHSFDEIEKAKQELATLRSDYEKRLSHIDEEARAKLQEVVQEGKKVAREMQDSARSQAKELLEKAKEDISLETAKARVALRREITSLAFAATERLIQEKMTEKKDEELIASFIKELEESKSPLIEL